MGNSKRRWGNVKQLQDLLLKVTQFGFEDLNQASFPIQAMPLKWMKQFEEPNLKEK